MNVDRCNRLQSLKEILNGDWCRDNDGNGGDCHQCYYAKYGIDAGCYVPRKYDDKYDLHSRIDIERVKADLASEMMNLIVE